MLLQRVGVLDRLLKASNLNLKTYPESENLSVLLSWLEIGVLWVGGGNYNFFPLCLLDGRL